MSDYECHSVQADIIRQSWEIGINDVLNGKSLDKVCPWEHLLSDDSLIVLSAISTFSKISDKQTKSLLLNKIATIIPNSHSRGILLTFYLENIQICRDPIDYLITLVKYYPLAMTSINMHLYGNFNQYFCQNRNKGERECEVIIWCQPYFNYMFEKGDLFHSTSLLEWLSQFRFRAVHEFLLSVVSQTTPHTSKSEYWLFIYKLLQIVKPGEPPTLISSNRYASIMFSVAAALPPGAPLNPIDFLMISPVLYDNITLTPGLIGLAWYIITKNPSSSIIPFVKKLVGMKYGVHINLFGCILYPLSLMGSLKYNDNIRKEITEIITLILNMRPCTSDERDSMSQDDYAETCIKTPSTIISLKMGQVLSHITEKGTKLIEQLLQKGKLSSFTASILCHCISIVTDRPSDMLMSTFRFTNDFTNYNLLTFAVIHMNLIDDNKVPQNFKVYYLYIRNIYQLTSNASSTIVKKIVKMLMQFAKQCKSNVIEIIYHIMWMIWQKHGGVVYDTFFSMISKPLRDNLDYTVTSIIRKICEGNRDVDIDDMKRIIIKYLAKSTDEKVICNCIDSLTYLCYSQLDVRQAKHLINRFVGDTYFSRSIALFYCAAIQNSPYPEMKQESLDFLWRFTSDEDVETAAIAYQGLLDSELNLNDTVNLFDKVSQLLERREYPDNADHFVSQIIAQELVDHPSQTVNNLTNPSKKLLTMFKSKDYIQSGKLHHALFSFSAITSGSDRQKHKRQIQQNEIVLASVLSKYSDKDFIDPFHGIIAVEGWCHFMYQYINFILIMPTYQQNKKKTDSNYIIEHLEKIKKDVKTFVQGELQGHPQLMFIQVLITTSITHAVYKIVLSLNIPLSKIKQTCAEDIGLLHTLSAFNKDNNTTKAILFLCIAYMANITQNIEDIDLLLMLLGIAKESVGVKEQLVSSCAGIATGVIIHTLYNSDPKSKPVSNAMQVLLDNSEYLGLSFCIDSFTNSIRKPATKKFIEDFILETTNGSHVMKPDRILFIGLLIAFLLYVDSGDMNELLEYLSYIGDKIDKADSVKDQSYYLMIQGIILYSTSCVYHYNSQWKECYTKYVEILTSAFVDNDTALPTLALVTGFPIFNLVGFFNWGPNTSLVAKFIESINKNMKYDNGKLCSLMIARVLEGNPATPHQYKSQSDSIWDLIASTMISLVQQPSIGLPLPKSKRKLRFILNILGKIEKRVPLSSPLEMLVTIFTRFTLEHEVIQFAGVHAKYSSPIYFQFISKFLCLSIYPQLNLQTQIELIHQLPNYIHLIPIRNLDLFFFKFLSETFWQGNEELRSTILNVLQSRIRDKTEKLYIKEKIVTSLNDNYFTQSNYHTLSKPIVDKISELMKDIHFWELPLQHLTYESDILLNFLKWKYKVPLVLERFFASYLNLKVNMFSDEVPQLLRKIVSMINYLDDDQAYDLLYTFMSKSNISLKRDSEDISMGIACLNTIVLSYVAHLSKQYSSTGYGVQHFLFMDNCIEPKVNVDCLITVLKNIEPWHNIIRLYEDVIGNR